MTTFVMNSVVSHVATARVTTTSARAAPNASPRFLSGRPMAISARRVCRSVRGALCTTMTMGLSGLRHRDDDDDKQDKNRWRIFATEEKCTGPLANAETPLKKLLTLLDGATEPVDAADTWKDGVTTLVKASQKAAAEAVQGGRLPRHAGQLAFELNRYISLLDMDIKLLSASREDSTRSVRLQQAQSRCRQSIQICETAAKVEGHEHEPASKE